MKDDQPELLTDQQALQSHYDEDNQESGHNSHLVHDRKKHELQSLDRERSSLGQFSAWKNIDYVPIIPTT